MILPGAHNLQMQKGVRVTINVTKGKWCSIMAAVLCAFHHRASQYSRLCHVAWQAWSTLLQTKYVIFINHTSNDIAFMYSISQEICTRFLLCCALLWLYIDWFSPYQSGLLHWHCGNLTIAPVPAKQPWWIWINTSCEFIMNDCITTTKQSTTKPCAYFLGYTVSIAKWVNEDTTFIIPYYSSFNTDKYSQFDINWYHIKGMKMCWISKVRKSAPYKLDSVPVLTCLL